jgi:hypothetical protein
VPQHNPLRVLRTIPSVSWLFWPWHALWTVGPYIDRCVSFQIMPNQLNWPQLDSIKLQGHLKDDQWKQDEIEFL